MAVGGALQISKMARLCVGNMEKEQYCSKRGVGWMKNEEAQSSVLVEGYSVLWVFLFIV